MPPLTAAINTTPDLQVHTRGPSLMQRDFARWEIADARAAIAWIIERRLTRAGFDANRRFAEQHDHLQDMAGWVGPDGGTDLPTRARVKENVTRQFTPVDVIAEVLDNVTNALLGTEAAVTFTPVKPAADGTTEAEAQQQEADAMLEVLARWWDRRRLWELARLAEKRARTYTWGTLRAWVPAPRGQVNAGDAPAAIAAEAGQEDVPETPEPGIPLETGLAFAEALDRIQLSAPAADQAFVYTDPETQETVGIFLFCTDDTEVVELVWIDPVTGETMFRQVADDGSDSTVSLDLGGQLLLAQMEADLLITEPVRMQQARLNFVESLIVRVMEQAGFPERILKNAKPNGLWSQTAPTGGVMSLDTQVVDGTTWYLIPMPRTIGASITTELRGIDRKDANGTIIGVETPDAQQFAPTDPTYAITLAKHARATILRQCKQGHLEMDDQTAPSGFARLVAKAPFIADVENNRPPLEGMLRDLLEGVIRLASLMSSDFAGFLERFRVGVQAHVNTGPIDPEEQAAILAQVQAGVLSQETALEYLGVEDVAAELVRLRGEPQAVLTMLTKQFQAMGLGTTAGLQMQTVAQMVGFTEEQQKLVTADATAFAALPENTQTLPGEVPAAADAPTAPGVPQLMPGPSLGAPMLAPSAPAAPEILAAIEALQSQVTALASAVAQQQTTINTPVSVAPASVTVNNQPQGEVQPRRRVRVQRLGNGDLIGEIVTDPESVSIPAGGGEGEITGRALGA